MRSATLCFFLKDNWSRLEIKIWPRSLISVVESNEGGVRGNWYNVEGWLRCVICIVYTSIGSSCLNGNDSGPAKLND